MEPGAGAGPALLQSLEEPFLMCVEEEHCWRRMGFVGEMMMMMMMMTCLHCPGVGTNSAAEPRNLAAFGLRRRCDRRRGRALPRLRGLHVTHVLLLLTPRVYSFAPPSSASFLLCGSQG